MSALLDNYKKIKELEKKIKLLEERNIKLQNLYLIKNKKYKILEEERDRLLKKLGMRGELH